MNPLEDRAPMPQSEDEAAARAIADAVIKIDSNNPHWTVSARDLITGLVMWEVEKARREGRAPLLENVGAMVGEGEAVKKAARCMVARGHRKMARFMRDSREIDIIIATARTHLRASGR